MSSGAVGGAEATHSNPNWFTIARTVQLWPQTFLYGFLSYVLTRAPLPAADGVVKDDVELEEERRKCPEGRA